MKQEIRKANKNYKFSGCCRDILKGEKYTACTLFPHEESYLSDGPYTVHMCSRCSYMEDNPEPNPGPCPCSAEKKGKCGQWCIYYNEWKSKKENKNS